MCSLERRSGRRGRDLYVNLARLDIIISFDHCCVRVWVCGGDCAVLRDGGAGRKNNSGKNAIKNERERKRRWRKKITMDSIPRLCNKTKQYLHGQNSTPAVASNC